MIKHIIINHDINNLSYITLLLYLYIH
jgi:hypothetical protein